MNIYKMKLIKNLLMKFLHKLKKFKYKILLKKYNNIQKKQKFML